jgi:hypothetical protein
MAAKATAKIFAPVLPHSYPDRDSITRAISDFFAQIGRSVSVAFEVFNEAQEQARKAHTRFPFAE